MTDIARLLASLKRRSAHVKEFGDDITFVKLEDLDVLVEALEKAQTINAAAEKLIRCKGRYHSEQNYRTLAALFGVTTPDLPPLEHENVHYADAAEMEIATLRQRIADLENQLKAAENNEIDARCRIAELEESHAQVIHACDHYKRMSEEGLQQLAESRTVTVKLPDDEDGQAYGFGKWVNGKLPATTGAMTISYCEDAWRAAFEVFSSVAGINVEAE